MKCSVGLWLLAVIIVLGIIAVAVQFLTPRVHVSPRLAEELFRNFTKKFNKSYDTPEEYQKRLNIFTQSLEDIVTKNMKKNATAEYGVTRYSDLTAEEFLGPGLTKTNFTHIMREEMNSVKYKPTPAQLASAPVKIVITTNGTAVNDEDVGDSYQSFYDPKLMTKNLNYVPLQVDWRNENVLLPVRKQGKCGACWAYSVTATIEANRAIRTGNKTRLSVQQMIDCARNGNNGCMGGDTCMLLEWLAENRIPIRTEAEYPLADDNKNFTCLLQGPLDEKKAKQFVRIDDFTCRSFVDDELKLLEVLANYGPVTAAVNAVSWQNYVGGIVQNECENHIENTNHAVEIVGYDRGGAVPHYIVQNSWGDDFGENGFMRIAIGSNVCGIANQVSFGRLM